MGYDAVFRRQVEAHGQPGDVAIGISTSGRSPSVRGRAARREGARPRHGRAHRQRRRPAEDAVDHLIDAPSPDTPRIQELHGLVIHLLCQIVEETLYPR